MHVLVIPLIHPGGERHYFHLCSCMDSDMHMLRGMSSAVTQKQVSDLISNTQAPSFEYAVS